MNESSHSVPNLCNSHRDVCCVRALIHGMCSWSPVVICSLCATDLRIYDRRQGACDWGGEWAAFLARIDWADYLNSATVVWCINKSVSMTILPYILMNLINLSTQYLSASNIISAFTVRTVYRMRSLPLHYLKCFLFSMYILGTSIYHTALTGGIFPLTELNLT